MAVLHILGVPLDEDQELAVTTRTTILACGLIIGESRKVTARFLKGSGVLQTEKCWFLDGLKPNEEKDLIQALKAAKSQDLDVALFSDTGMPLLFDPGKEIVKKALTLGFRLKSHPGPTSWGTAACLSLWEPPFKIVGFPPRDREARLAFLRAHTHDRAHCLWMDTPYRYQALSAQLEETFGGSRPCFLAWEIGKPTERLWWGTLKELKTFSTSQGLEKGEFILLTEGAQ